MGLLDRLQHAWNAFVGSEPYTKGSQYVDLGYSTTFRPDRITFTRGIERSIVTSLYNRIAIDCAGVNIRHVKLDDDKRYIDDIKSSLNGCLSLEPNKDQSARAFFQDIVMSLFDEGTIAIVPIDTTTDIKVTDSYEILSLRTGRITQWFPDHVRVEVYNDRLGMKQEIVMEKKSVAIIENPLYAVMNERNSVLQRLIRKLNLLDAIDEQSGSGKLDLIIQLPYVIKSDARKKQADMRRQDMEKQLSGSKYGIAYTDGTEKVTQLNRPVENNLLKQIEYLTSMLYSQLGITISVLDGSADEKVMLNYMNRTVEPIIGSIVQEMNRKFLTKTARSQNQVIKYFSDPFRLVPLGNLADIVDKFTRNEVLSSNEVRQIIGVKPSKDPEADKLRNKNLNPGVGQRFAQIGAPENSVPGQKTKFRVTYISQGGAEEEIDYEADNEQTAIQKVMDGANVPRENIKKVVAA